MTTNTTIALVAAGVLGVLLYASSKKPGNNLPLGSPTPEPSPAPPQGSGQPDPLRLITLGYCCPAGQNLSGDRCYGADNSGNHVYMGQATLCRVGGSTSMVSNLANIFKKKGPSAPAIKCCDARDKECKCTSWHWSKSSDCKDVACGSAGIAGLNISNLLNGLTPKNSFNAKVLC